MCLTVLLSGCSNPEQSPAEPPPAAPAAKTQELAKKVESDEPYQSPIDFKKLQQQNEDIYAWLEIPGTEISFPVVQHPENDAYYLKHNVDKQDDRDGAIFTEHEFTKKDFSDPVTVIYGHNMRKKNFGRLQEYYSDGENIKNLSKIILYLPEKELHYAVFAAVPFDNRHILYSHDFQNQHIFELFFQHLCSIRAFGANFAEENFPKKDDHVLILSTCLMGDLNQRYLVCAIEQTAQ